MDTPVISVSSVSINDIDMLNKELSKYPQYEPFSAYTYLGKTTILLRKAEVEATHEVEVIDLQFTNSILEFNQWLEQNPGWKPLAMSNNQGKSWAYVFRSTVAG